jgi:hypothetical protein
MTGETFDSLALIRALILSLGAGLVVASVASLLKKWPKAVLVMLGIGVALILTVILFYSWPSLVKVPDLSGLARAEAELVLEKKGLIPEARPQYDLETPAERVIAYSQEPLAGIKVHRGTVVRFGVALTPPPSETTERESASVSLFHPKSGENVHCTRYADGVYRFAVVGTSIGLSDRLTLLLWIRPVKPPSETPGWYLQRLPVNGITKIEPDGSWEGIAQIGNVQWSLHAGEVLDVAVTVVDVESANRLLAKSGVVTSIYLPGVVSDIASGVRVKLK